MTEATDTVSTDLAAVATPAPANGNLHPWARLKCPDCGAPMVLRSTNKFRHDDGTGRKFYGCSRLTHRMLDSVAVEAKHLAFSCLKEQFRKWRPPQFVGNSEGLIGPVAVVKAKRTRITKAAFLTMRLPNLTEEFGLFRQRFFGRTNRVDSVIFSSTKRIPFSVLFSVSAHFLRMPRSIRAGLAGRTDRLNASRAIHVPLFGEGRNGLLFIALCAGFGCRINRRFSWSHT